MKNKTDRVWIIISIVIQAILLDIIICFIIIIENMFVHILSVFCKSALLLQSVKKHLPLFAR